jgi:YHS domain-containing protein
MEARAYLQEVLMKHAKEARDPVCGMMVDIDPLAIQTTYQGTHYYFCSKECLDAFVAEPAKYVAAERDGVERAGMPTPKFGSAGSGGAEYEPAPGNKS